jgi:hypothetical protein
MGHFGPIIEAERDETLGQYLQIMVRRLQSSLLDLRHLQIRPSRHPRAGILVKISLYFHIKIVFLIIIQDFKKSDQDQVFEEQCEFFEEQCEFLRSSASF